MLRDNLLRSTATVDITLQVWLSKQQNILTTVALKKKLNLQFCCLVATRSSKTNQQQLRTFYYTKKLTTYFGLTGTHLALTTLHQETNIKVTFLKFLDV